MSKTNETSGTAAKRFRLNGKRYSAGDPVTLPKGQFRDFRKIGLVVPLPKGQFRDFRKIGLVVPLPRKKKAAAPPADPIAPPAADGVENSEGAAPAT